MFVAVELAGFALAEKEPVQKANFEIKFWLRIDIPVRMVHIIIIVSKDFTKLVTLNPALLHILVLEQGSH